MAHYLRVKKSPPFTGTFGAVAIVLMVISVVAAAMLIATREPSRVDIASVEAQPEDATVEASAKKASASKTLSAGATPATRLSTAVTPPTARKESAAKKASASEAPSAGSAPVPRLARDTPPASAPDESASNTLVPTQAAVTIAGCLERSDETFRLKDTTGVAAPKSRSWRSGFLKKGSTSIEVVDAANRLKLTDHVGQRVSVTGVLVDREIHVRSLQRVATSCTS